jgi:hypothetical protein
MSELNCPADFEQESSAVEPPKKLWHRPEVRVSSVPGVTAFGEDLNNDGRASCS